MRILIYTLLLLISLYLVYKYREPQLDKYNAYICATEGYQQDCQTPLAQDNKLK